MSRINLFSKTRPEDSDFALALLSAETILTKHVPSIALPDSEDEITMVITRAESEIEEDDALAEAGIRSIAALEDTAYVIAPSITEARESDIALVRQVAATVGPAIGLPAEDLFSDKDQLAVGAPLVLEGFKERVAQAAYAVWQFISQVLEGYIVVFNVMAEMIVGGADRISGIAKKVDAKQPYELVAPTEFKKNWAGMASDIKHFNMRAITDHLTAQSAMTGVALKLMQELEKGMKLLVNTNDFTKFPDQLEKSLAVTLGTLQKMTVPGSALGGAKIIGVADAVNAPDTLAKYKAFEAIKIERIKVDNVTPPSDLMLFKNDGDFVDFMTSYMLATKNINGFIIGALPTAIRMSARNAKALSLKAKAQWAAQLDKLPPEQQEELRPYAAAIAEFFRQAVRLTGDLGKILTNDVSANYRAAASYLEATVKFK